MPAIAPVLHFPAHEVYITLLLFLCVGALAWVRINNPKKIPSLVISFFRGGTTEENTISPDSIALFLVFICAIALLCMEFLPIHHVNFRTEGVKEFFLLGGALIAWYLLKTIAILLCGFIFGVPNSARDYINETFVFTHITGIILLPVAIFCTYAVNINLSLLEKCMAGVLGFLLLYRTIKMFILMANKGLSIFYLFLYLCALEIIPLILIYEYAKGIKF